MTAKKKGEDPNGKQAVKTILKDIFRKHPTRNFNYKQMLRLIAQEHPVVYARTFFDDDRNANRSFLNELMYQMVIDGDLIETDRGRFKSIPILQYAEGIIDITTSGVAYVMNDLFEDDIFIAPGHALNALGGDTVKVLLSATKPGGRRTGKVVEVLKRSKTEIVGVLSVMPKFAFLIPDSNRNNIDIFIPIQNLHEIGRAHV